MICKPTRLLVILVGMVIILALDACYSFKGYSINQDVTTYYVGQFKLAAYNAPVTINQTFTEAFKDKVARESRLKFTNDNPDIEFEGTIKSFTVAATAPQPNEQTAFNRLTIIVDVIYTNHKDEKDQWTRSFSHFADFAVDQDLLAVQDELIDVIFKQIMEDIFNQAFNNW